MYDDHVGVKFGKLTAVDESEVRTLSNGKKSRFWKCMCDCGGVTYVRRSMLINGNTKSCGCFSAESTRARFTKHGHSTNNVESPTYYSWHNMMKRCTIPTAKQYKDYGGRGIKVCAKWQKFSGFLKDMGDRPEGMTLDRINISGDYKKSNCRWASNRTQSRNRSDNRMLVFKGITMCLTDWAAELEMNEATIRCRLDRYGWSIEEALTKEKRQRK